MKPLVSCLMPTFRRYPDLGWLVEEAVESFLRQDYPHAELIVGNDTPGQTLEFTHPRVQVVNWPTRFPTLSDKLIAMIDLARGDVLCRWDDDDISLPHRLSLSVDRLGNNLEWRAENFWYDTGTLVESRHPANTHTFGIWRREVLDRIGGYPANHSGTEDVAFNRALVQAGLPARGDVLDHEDIFYLYRWATGSRHISGGGGDEAAFRDRYRQLGERPMVSGQFPIQPRWRRNHLARADQAVRMVNQTRRDPASIPGYFDWPDLYRWIVAMTPPGGRIVEVGCLHGKSLTFLATEAKRANKRLQVIGVDLGRGLDTCPDFHQIGGLLANVRDCGVADVCSVIAAESTAGASLFADESLDVVFLDAAHDDQSVRADLQAWWPKVRVGGRMAGHDYGDRQFPGVALAVDEFFGMEPGKCQSPRAAKCWERVKTMARTEVVRSIRDIVPVKKPREQSALKLVVPKTPAAPSIGSTDVRFSVVMPCYDDFEGVEKTVQGLRLMHAHRLAEIIVLDNHPVLRPIGERGKPRGHSELTWHLCEKVGARYIPYSERVGTAAAKDAAFRAATTDYVICTDSHNLFPLGSLDALAAVYETDRRCPDLLQGPCWHDSLASCWTHFIDVWGQDSVWGQWAFDKEKFERGEPFDIWSLGLGAFACRRDSWVGFHPLLRGFGGEETFLHLRHRRAGHRTRCVPGFGWVHRWGRGTSVPYPGLTLEDKARNAIIGFLDLRLDLERCRHHFTEELKQPMSEERFEVIVLKLQSGPSGVTSKDCQ